MWPELVTRSPGALLWIGRRTECCRRRESRRGTIQFFYECGEAVNGNPYVEVEMPETAGPDGPDRYAAALLRDPDARRKVGEHWAELTKPETTVVDAARLLGIEPEPEQPNRC